MGKKVKTGKSRKDKFYHLAKETGFRARSAFKLLQLNRKFAFLEKCKVCVDLCAAPGGWMQVAVQNMPVQSLIIGFDLVPIKPIRGAVAYQEDITTEKCRQTLKKELKDWKVDIFLHDGAPNVGKSWVHDAFQQAELTLHAMRLATEFLRKGGWFITKVFRSKDYHALMWVFTQLFNKVHATKPQASRNESAEIFVVCQGFKAPDKLDPKFTDPKYVFKDVESTTKKGINLIHPEKEKKKTIGYEEGNYTQHTVLKATDFVNAENHLEVLATASQIVIDIDAIKTHPSTTTEIMACCEDIRVLGKKEIRGLVSWRNKLKKDLEKILKAQKAKEGDSDEDGEDSEEGSDSEEGEVKEMSEEEDEEGKIQEQLEEVADEERRELKRKKKQMLKEKNKLRQKMSLNMVIPGDRLDTTDDINLFDIKRIKSKKQLSEVEKNEMAEMSSDSDAESTDSEAGKRKKAMIKYDRFAQPQDDDMEYLEDDDYHDTSKKPQIEEFELESEDEEQVAEGDENPLVVSMDTKDTKAKRKMEMWFSKDAFSGLEGEDDEDLEIDAMTKDYTEKGGTILGKNKEQTQPVTTKKTKKKKHTEKESEADSGNDSEIVEDIDSELKQRLSGQIADDDVSDSSDDDSDNESDVSDYDVYETMKKGAEKGGAKRKSEVLNSSSKDGFEIVPQSRKIQKLDPTGLAIGEELIKSSKRRREIIESSYNRYMFNDDGLPDWFTQDEKKNCKKQLPVTKAQVDEYKLRMKAINAQSIGKVAEAKARKKKKIMKRLEKARKKAEKLTDTQDLTDREKMRSYKEIYKRAGLLKSDKKTVEYVVAKRGTGKRVSRPAGVKGRFKVVDPRMKKDEMKRKFGEKQARKLGKKGKGKGKGNKGR